MIGEILCFSNQVALPHILLKFERWQKYCFFPLIHRFKDFLWELHFPVSKRLATATNIRGYTPPPAPLPTELTSGDIVFWTSLMTSSSLTKPHCYLGLNTLCRYLKNEKLPPTPRNGDRDILIYIMSTSFVFFFWKKSMREILRLLSSMYCKAYKMACMNVVLDKIQLTRLLNRLIHWSHTSEIVKHNCQLFKIIFLWIFGSWRKKKNYESLFPSRFLA